MVVQYEGPQTILGVVRDNLVLKMGRVFGECNTTQRAWTLEFQFHRLSV